MKTANGSRITYSFGIIFLAFFCYTVPFIDAANGFLVLSGSGEGSAGTIGQLYKAAILIVGWLIIRKKLIVALLAIYLLLIEQIGLMLHQTLGFFLIGFAYSFKLIFAAVIYFLIVDLVKKYGACRVVRLFRNSAVLYSIIFFLSIFLGVSHATYVEGSFGSKGLFSSGNALSIYFGSMSLIGLYLFFLSKSKLDLFYSFVLLVSVLFVGTKTSILFVALYFLLLTYKVSSIYKILFLSFFALLTLSFYDYFSLFFDVIVYRFENSESFSSFLASSRDVFVINALSTFNIEGFYLLRLIFGLGVYMSFRTVSDDISLYDTLENDFFDVFFSYGFIGSIVYIMFFLFHAVKAIASRNITILLIFCVMYLLSALVGHVLFDAMAIVPLILSAALTTINLRKSFEKDRICTSAQ